MQNDFLPFLDPAAVRPFVEQDGEWVNLRFDYATIQSSMRRDDPFSLELEYTRAMLLFMLFMPVPARILMIGLGGGSLPKYFHKHMPACDITVIEVNPHVIALRDEFMVPADGKRFRVIRADGADWVATAALKMPGAFDVMLVDGFNFNGPAAQLETQAFIDASRTVLAPGGVLVLNLDSEESGNGQTLARLRNTFDGGVLEMLADGGTNRLVFAADPELLRQGREDAPARFARLAPVHQATMNRRSSDRERWPLIDSA